MSDARLWLAGLIALPLLVVAASWFRVDIERLRRLDRKTPCAECGTLVRPESTRRRPCANKARRAA